MFYDLQCILRFVTFSFSKKVLTNRVLLTNRVKCDKSGKWGISCGLNFLQYRLNFLKTVDFQKEQKIDRNRKTLCKMYQISRKRVNLWMKEKVCIIRNKFVTWKKFCMKKMLHEKMLHEKNPQKRLALDFVGEIRCTGSWGTQILNVTKNRKKCQLLDKNLSLGRTIFFNFVGDKNLKSPNWYIPQVSLPSTGPRPRKILN